MAEDNDLHFPELDSDFRPATPEERMEARRKYVIDGIVNYLLTSNDDLNNLNVPTFLRKQKLIKEDVDIIKGKSNLASYDNLLTSISNHVGTDVYLVGGPVRDALLGRKSKDIDVVAMGTPEHVSRFEASGATRIKKDFPVYTHPKFPGVEIAFGRKERKTGESHTSFDWNLAPDLKTDLLRRDLTINSIAYHPKHGLVDPLGGIDHLNSGLLVAPTDAFKEDPTRILRTARFASQLNMEPDEHTVSLMKFGASGLKTEPKERIRGEMEKALKTKNPAKFFKVLSAGKSLGHWFPELEALENVPAGNAKNHPEGDVFNHSLLALQTAADQDYPMETKLFSLLHDVGKAHTDPTTWPKHHGHEKFTQPGVDFIKRLDYGDKLEKQVALHILNHLYPYSTENRPNREEHRPGRTVKYFDDVKQFFTPHILAVNADINGRGKPYQESPVIEKYKKLFTAYKSAGHGEMTKDRRHQERAAAIRKALKDMGIS